MPFKKGNTYYKKYGFQKGNTINLGKKYNKERVDKVSNKNRGQKRTEEQIKRISDSHLGLTPSNKGVYNVFHHTEETKKLISESSKGRFVSEETRIKRSKALKGKKVSEERRSEMSETMKKMWENPEYREKQRKSHEREKSHRWLGGKQYEKYGEEWTRRYRDEIIKRDLFKCSECGILQKDLIGRHKKLSVHHIDYNKKNCEPNNLITLCISCHAKTNINRDYWEEYFKEKYEK